MPHPRRRSDAPLYDPSFEHDACGIGFVADAGGRSRDRVLPLALGGLAALGHRGAFGADGESSDGAGVMLPLEAPLLELLAGGAARRPAGGRDAVPAWPGRRRGDPRPASSSPRRSRPKGWQLRRGGACRSTPARWARRRPRPGRTSPRRSSTARSTPAPAARSRTPSSTGASSSPGAGWRSAARAEGLDDLSVASMSCRTVVYKGLVAGGRLAAFYPDLARADRAQPRPVPPALRDEHPADLAPRPAVPLDRPQRRDRHRPRQPRAGPGPDRRRRRGAGGGRGARPRRGRAAPLAGGLRLAVARRDDRAARRDRLGPGLGAAGRDARGVVPPPRAAPARGHAPAGNRRAARPVGRPGRDRLLRRPPGRGDPRPQRAPTGGVRGDVGPARRGRVGGRGDPPGRVRHGPPRAAGPGRDAPRRPAARGDPRGRRREGPPAPPPADPRRAASGPRRPGTVGRDATARNAVVAPLPRRA